MLTKQDRYINTDLMELISRPQYDYSCSMSALTAVINYLFSDQIGIKTTKVWAQDIAIQSPEASMSPGNQTVMEWFIKVCKHYCLVGSCDYFIQKKDVEDWNNNPQVITKLKNAVRNDKQALIYHMSNHYNVVIGFFEHATEPDKAYSSEAELDRWIVFGEHSDYVPYKGLIDTAGLVLPDDKYNLVRDKASGPIWCRRWKNIRHDLINTPNHCILSFQK